jgi:hypothetical protein
MPRSDVLLDWGFAGDEITRGPTLPYSAIYDISYVLEYWKLVR